MIYEATWSELMLGAVVGVMRRVSALKRSRSTAYGAGGDIVEPWQVDIEGAIGELIVAKQLDRYWHALAANGDVRREWPDVGTNIQVRSTTRLDGALIVHPSDADDHIFYLVRGCAPSYQIVGWIAGRDAKQDCWWRDDVRVPAYFVPEMALEAP